MGSEVARFEPQEQRPMTLPEMKEQMRVLGELLKHVMQKNTHFGTIPGTPKPTLYKPGAEKIIASFRLVPQARVEDLSGLDHQGMPYHRYRVTASLYNRDGILLGEGVGEASSLEEKYMWRAAVCDEEFDVTPEDRKRVKYAKKQGGGHYTVKQIRTNAADIANTVLKMSDKRALIAVVLKVTAASDIFTQDLEDLSPEVREAVHGEAEQKPPMQPPQEKKAEKTDDEKRGELVDLGVVYSTVKGITFEAAIKEFSVFTGTDGKEKFKEDPKGLSGKWLNSSLGRARELAKPFMDDNGQAKPQSGDDDDLPF